MIVFFGIFIVIGINREKIKLNGYRLKENNYLSKERLSSRPNGLSSYTSILAFESHKLLKLKN